MKRITAKMLRDAGACESQVQRFEREWPDGAPVTLENCRRAIELKLDTDWVASNLLSRPARAAYYEAMARAWAAHDEATARVGAAYDKATAPTRTAYEAATASTRATYREAIARAFCDAFNQGGQSGQRASALKGEDDAK